VARTARASAPRTAHLIDFRLMEVACQSSWACHLSYLNFDVQSVPRRVSPSGFDRYAEAQLSETIPDRVANILM
jgi:hypothetical protein